MLLIYTLTRTIISVYIDYQIYEVQYYIVEIIEYIEKI